jgi:hypothetical protein
MLVVAAAVALSGCVVEGSLDATGAARLRVRYRLVSVAHFEQAKPRLQSDDVRLVGASMTPDKWATYELEMADVRRLPTAPAFARTTVTLRDEADGARTLVVEVPPDHAELPAPYVAYLGGELRVSLELPGDVVRSNARAVAGRTASWVLPLAGPKRAAASSFTVTFRPAAG